MRAKVEERQVGFADRICRRDLGHQNAVDIFLNLPAGSTAHPRCRVRLGIEIHQQLATEKKSSIDALYVIEVPIHLPLDAPAPGARHWP